MGFGYWLDPVKQQSWSVWRHELWVLDQRNAQAAGIPQAICDHLLTLNPSEGQDEIRLAAIEAGLVRIRDHGNYISVQFAAEPNRLREVLRSVHKFLAETTTDKYADIIIDNFTTRESARLSLAELGKRLAEDTPIFVRDDLTATSS